MTWCKYVKSLEHYNAIRKANILSNQYKSVFTIDENNNQEKLPLPKRILPDMPDISITVEGVRKLLSQLNPSKASGPDKMPPRILKELANEIAPAIQ